MREVHTRINYFRIFLIEQMTRLYVVITAREWLRVNVFAPHRCSITDLQVRNGETDDENSCSCVFAI